MSTANRVRISMMCFPSADEVEEMRGDPSFTIHVDGDGRTAAVHVKVPDKVSLNADVVDSITWYELFEPADCELLLMYYWQFKDYSKSDVLLVSEHVEDGAIIRQTVIADLLIETWRTRVR